MKKVIFFIVLLILGFAVCLLSMMLFEDLMISGLITFTVLYFFIIFIMLRVNIFLDIKCDPVKALKALKLFEVTTFKTKKTIYALGVTRAACLSTLGQYKEAKEILNAVGQIYKTNNKYLMFGYHSNFLTVLFELGELESAERLYQYMQTEYANPNKKMELFMQIDSADRLFFMGKLEESKQLYLEILKRKWSNRVQVSIFYRLAQIEELSGSIADAKIKYQEVAARGNKMIIATIARNKVNVL